MRTSAAAVGLAMLAVRCGGAAEPARVRLPAGDGPGVVALADLNGDGRLDIVAANERGGSVSVFVNAGGRRFSPAPGSPFEAGPHPNDVAVADFNRDGKPDLAFANHETQRLTVLLGDGRGEFSPASFSPIRTAVKPHPHGLAAADFDGDGWPDLATDSWGEDRLEIVFNPGRTGAWTRTAFVPAGKHPYQRIRSADFDRDGRADLASANLEGDDATILLGDGKGGFRQPAGSPFSAGDSPFNAAVGDVDGDGVPDIAVVNSPSSTSDRTGRDGLTVLLNDGRGKFRAASGSPFSVGRFPNMAAIGRLGSPGAGHVAVTLPESDRIALFSFSRGGALASRREIAVAGHPKGVAIGDLDGDGRGDIVLALNSGNAIEILFDP